jgi:MOSC domain-containing protein
MHVEGLWRYPIKSLGGEALRTAELTRDGVAGDRLVHVTSSRGPITGRSRPGLLTIPGSTGDAGVPCVGGARWDSAEAAAIVAERAGPDARLTSYGGPERFDVLNLLVATDGAVNRLGADIRRLRPNLLIGGVPEDAELHWPGNALAIGGALVGLHSLRQRCVVTTIDPDTGDQDPDVLRRIRRDFDGELALDAWVIEPGAIAIGDPVLLVSTDAEPDAIGGWVVGAPYLAA